MNYIVEDNFDFFKELNDLPVNDLPDNKCMISHSTLTHNFVTLPCKHSFNYLPLYKELCLYNNKKTITCPYCRSISTQLIPFIPLPGVIKIIGVNHPEKQCQTAPYCSVILKMGARKGLQCGINGMETEKGNVCIKHQHTLKDDIWTEAMAVLMTSKTVTELKQMLKKRGLKVGGIKKELVKRLLLS
jgi:hypothetical protein